MTFPVIKQECMGLFYFNIREHILTQSDDFKKRKVVGYLAWCEKHSPAKRCSPVPAPVTPEHFISTN